MTSSGTVLAVGGQRTVEGMRERRVITPTTVSDSSERFNPHARLGVVLGMYEGLTVGVPIAGRRLWFTEHYPTLAKELSDLQLTIAEATR